MRTPEEIAKTVCEPFTLRAIAPGQIRALVADGAREAQNDTNDALKGMLMRVVRYAEEGNRQAVEFARSTDSLRWSGKSHAYIDMIEFIENEVMPELDGDHE